jgi:hypothetical protein
MRNSRLLAFSVAAAAALFMTGVAVAAPAGANPNYPDDCSVANASPAPTRIMTCTARPATQQWRINLFCSFGAADKDVYGNVVTGDGKSTAHCPLSSFQVLAYFNAVS